MKTLLYRICQLAFFFIQCFNSFAQSDPSFQEDSIHLQRDNFQIKGTLCMPTGVSEKIPVLLLVAGSGPTDRNGNNSLGSVKSDAYLLFAHALAKKGIASVRYDKRAIGQSRPPGKINMAMLFQQEVQDIADWITQLRKDIRFSTIIVAGHSQGALMAVQVASKADKFISLNGLGVKANQLLRDQLSAQPQFVLQKSLPILDSLEKGLPATDIPPYLNTLFNPDLQLYWMSMFKVDPPEELSRLQIPALIIQGDNDIQVKVSDAETFVSKSPKARLLVLSGMNHLFKVVATDKTANLRSYTDPKIPIDPALVNAVVTFIQ